jgi:hypothetical protein
MTNYKTRQKGKRELMAIFRACRIRDGLTEKEITDKWTFWYNLERTGKRGNYIIYEVLDSPVLHRADDKVLTREFFCQVDVFSLDSFETERLAVLIDSLETALTAAGFEVIFKDEMYENDTKLFHVPIFISKLYAEGGLK